MYCQLCVVCLVLLATVGGRHVSERTDTARAEYPGSNQPHVIDELGNKITRLMTKKRGMFSGLADKLDGLLATVKGPLLELKGSLLTKSGAFLTDAGYKLLGKANYQYYKAGEYWSSKYAGTQGDYGDYYYEGGYPNYDYTSEEPTGGEQATQTGGSADNIAQNTALNPNNGLQLSAGTNTNFQQNPTGSGQFTPSQLGVSQTLGATGTSNQYNSGQQLINSQQVPINQLSAVSAGYSGAQAGLVNQVSMQLTNSGIKSPPAVFSPVAQAALPTGTASASVVPATSAAQQLQQLQQLHLARQQSIAWQQQQKQQQLVNTAVNGRAATQRPSLIAWPSQQPSTQTQQYPQQQQQTQQQQLIPVVNPPQLGYLPPTTSPTSQQQFTQQQQQQQQFPQQQQQFSQQQQQQQQFPQQQQQQQQYPQQQQRQQQIVPQNQQQPQIFLPPASSPISVQFQNTLSPLSVQQQQSFLYPGQATNNQFSTPIARSSTVPHQQSLISTLTGNEATDFGVVEVDDLPELFSFTQGPSSPSDLRATAVISADSDLTLDQFQSGTFLLDNVELDEDGVITLELVEADSDNTPTRRNDVTDPLLLKHTENDTTLLANNSDLSNNGDIVLKLDNLLSLKNREGDNLRSLLEASNLAIVSTDNQNQKALLSRSRPTYWPSNNN